jgi:hypothetical protein
MWDGDFANKILLGPHRSEAPTENTINTITMQKEARRKETTRKTWT